MLLLTIVLVSACTSTSTNQNQLNDSTAVSSDCRLVQHGVGETCVPLNPQRIVALSGLDAVLSLGVKPIASSSKVSRSDYSYLGNKRVGIEDVGRGHSPNLEVIAALKPDLILGIDVVINEDSYGLLSQIAPTVVVKWEHGNGWKKQLSKYAEALGKTDKAEQILADYHARIEKFQAQMGDRLKQTEVSIVRVSQAGIQVYLEDSNCGGVVADAGLPRPDHQTKYKDTLEGNISKELLHKTDGDVIFVWQLGVDEEEAQKSQTALEELKADPLWLKLNAVQEGKVYEVPSRWISFGPTAANLILDDLFKYLVDPLSQAAQ